MDGRGLLEVFLLSLSKGLCCHLYVFLITHSVIELETVDYPTFLVLGVLVLWFHEDMFYCGVSFEVSLYAMLTTCVFETVHQPLCVWYDNYPMMDLGLEMVAVTVLAFGLLLACALLFLFPVCVSWSMLLEELLLVSWRLLLLESSLLIFKSLLCTLLVAQWGYLHFTKAFWRCCNSLSRSSGPAETVLALWVGVLMTLYLPVRLWWLPYCKYCSVCVGLQYTVMERE